MRDLLVKKALEIAETRDFEEAAAFQNSCRELTDTNDGFGTLRLAAGVDLAYKNDCCYAAIVTVGVASMDVKEVSVAVKPVQFPYVPGFLFYREFPAFLEAWKKLKLTPDLLIFDGQGIAHPRGMGIAAMAGMLMDVPSIGCAKSRLYGEYIEPPHSLFASSELTANGKVIGSVFRSRYDPKRPVKPLFISPGHKVSVASSLEIVKSLVTQYRLPLPTHWAHRECEALKEKGF